MRVLITGGAGFIGANLVRWFNEHDPSTEVVVLDDLSTGKLSNLEGCDAKFIEGSVANPIVVEQAMEGVDSVVHLGALGSVPRSVKDPMGSHVANLTGTLVLLEAARREGAQVIFASSSSVYGANKKLPKSEFDWTRPMSPYAVTKLGAEGYVLAYQFAYGLPTLAFRFFNVYGPLQAADHAYAAVIPKFLDALGKGEALQIESDGGQSRDFTYVDTVCDAIYKAVTRELSSPDPVNLAFGTRTSILELASEIEDVSGKVATTEHVAPRVGDVRASEADGKRIAELLPDVEPVDLRTGLAATIEWFESQGSGATLE